jgi:hypothetical protein
MAKRPLMKTRAVIVQLVCIAIAVILGALMLMKRVGAEPRRPRRIAFALSSPSASSSSSSSAAAAAAAPAASGSAAHEDQIDTAVLGPNGGVPVHTEGPFRSPFASPGGGPAAEVRVGLVLNDVTNYSIMTGNFTADFYLSLTSDKPMPSMDLIFPNGKADTKEVIADKPTFKFYRFTGSFVSPPDLRKYPFDSQHLEIQIEENTEGIDQFRLVPDRSHTHLEAGFSVIGWDISYLEAISLVHDFPDRFDNDDLYYGRYSFRLGIQRYGNSAIFTVYVPAIVIVLISLMGMWVPAEKMEVRSNAGAPMLAAAVLFHFALMQQLPATPYLTRADKLMIGVYVSLFLCMLSTWWFFIVDEEHEGLVFKWSRRLVPPVSVALMTFASVI